MRQLAVGKTQAPACCRHGNPKWQMIDYIFGHYANRKPLVLTPNPDPERMQLFW